MLINRNDPRLIDPDRDKQIPIMFSHTFKGYWDRQDEEAQRQIFTRIMDTIDELKKKRPGNTRLWNVLRGVDYFIENAHKEPTCAKEYWDKKPCKKGCTHCCHMNVLCTDEEADLIYNAALKKGLTIDVERLKGQVGVSDEEYWALPIEKSRCALLQPDGTCGVYDERPLSCRNYMVASDPAICADHTPSTNIMIMFSVKGEILATAYTSLRYHETWKTWETLNLPARLLRLIPNTQIEAVKADNNDNL